MMVAEPHAIMVMVALLFLLDGVVPLAVSLASKFMLANLVLYFYRDLLPTSRLNAALKRWCKGGGAANRLLRQQCLKDLRRHLSDLRGGLKECDYTGANALIDSHSVLSMQAFNLSRAAAEEEAAAANGKRPRNSAAAAEVANAQAAAAAATTSAANTGLALLSLLHGLNPGGLPRVFEAIELTLPHELEAAALDLYTKAARDLALQQSVAAGKKKKSSEAAIARFLAPLRGDFAGYDRCSAFQLQRDLGAEAATTLMRDAPFINPAGAAPRNKAAVDPAAAGRDASAIADEVSTAEALLSLSQQQSGRSSGGNASDAGQPALVDAAPVPLAAAVAEAAITNEQLPADGGCRRSGRQIKVSVRLDRKGEAAAAVNGGVRKVRANGGKKGGGAGKQQRAAAIKDALAAGNDDMAASAAAQQAAQLAAQQAQRQAAEAAAAAKAAAAEAAMAARAVAAAAAAAAIKSEQLLAGGACRRSGREVKVSIRLKRGGEAAAAVNGGIAKRRGISSSKKQQRAAAVKAALAVSGDDEEAPTSVNAAPEAAAEAETASAAAPPPPPQRQQRQQQEAEAMAVDAAAVSPEAKRSSPLGKKRSRALCDGAAALASQQQQEEESRPTKRYSVKRAGHA